MDETELQRRFSSSPIARLATVRPDGAPHVVPVVFAVADGTIFTAVDHKPKRSPRLQRLANLRAEPRCSVLVDHYSDDWDGLWWVRADGRATIVDQPAEDHPGIRALAARHPQYARRPPAGPLVVVTVDRWSGWSPATTPFDPSSPAAPGGE